MNRILFPGNMRQACEAYYGVMLQKDEGPLGVATILVVQTDKINPGAMGTSLWNTDEGRDSVLNRILGSELAGVRVEFVRFVCALDVGGQLHTMELPIRLNVEDYIARGNSHNVSQSPPQDWFGTLKNAIGLGDKEISYWSVDVVGGCAKFYTEIDEQKVVDPSTVRDWMKIMSCPF
jgi:hypothetical protein